MIRRLPIFLVSIWLFAGTASFVPAQVPAPPVPPQVPGQVLVPSAGEPPRPLTPPPLPGQLQPVAPAPVPAQPTPAPPPLTQPTVMQEAPRVSSTADKLPITSSTSTSRQFIVHGKVFETRSAMSSRCEEISAELRKVLNDKEPWVLPVIVLLNTGAEATKYQGPVVNTSVTEMEHGGIHLQVTINERPGLNAVNMREGIVRALLAERIVRNHQKITKPQNRLVLPDWIMTGVLHAMDYKASARPSAIFSTIFRSGKIYGIEEIIAASPVEMDGLSRTIYETSCCALVLALVDQPNGPQNFNKFLNALASDPRSERELLDLAFPKFAASASSLNKWWSLQLATLSRPGIAEPLPAADSLKAIEDAIQIRYAAKPDEVPQNVRPRPFVLPTPLAMPTAPPQPRQPADAPVAHEEHQGRTSPPKHREVAAQQSAGQSPATTAEEEEGEGTEEKPKRPLWRRMLFLGAAKPDDAPPPTEDSDATPPVEEKKEKPESKPGFFGRMLGADGGEKKPKEKDKEKEKEKPAEPEKAVTAAVEKPKAAEKPKTPAKEKEEQPKPAQEEKEKASKLNPLNWFKGGKKPAEETKEKDQDKGAEKDEQASAASSMDSMARLLSPALADAWQALAPAAPRQTADVLNFLRRKPKEEEAAPEPEPAPAKTEPKPAKSSKPRTSNPNSKPAARPKPSTPDAPRTNNPNAKPVPAAAAAAAGVTGAGTAPASPTTGLVAVSLPLEEYKLILKHKDRDEILERSMADLRTLDLRVSPLFRPVILAYLTAFKDLKDGKTKDMDKRIATLREFALLAYQKTVAVRDYLDYYEANESGSLSGRFDDYLNLPSIIEKELPPRTDPISKYLEAIDQEFSK